MQKLAIVVSIIVAVSLLWILLYLNTKENRPTGKTTIVYKLRNGYKHGTIT